VTRKHKLARVDKVAIVKAAWKAAYLERSQFTTMALAARLKMPCNRHFQACMNQLAKDGLLAAYRRLDDDGRWRKYFYAQESKPMFEAQGKEKVA